MTREEGLVSQARRMEGPWRGAGGAAAGSQASMQNTYVPSKLGYTIVRIRAHESSGALQMPSDLEHEGRTETMAASGLWVWG